MKSKTGAHCYGKGYYEACRKKNHHHTIRPALIGIEPFMIINELRQLNATHKIENLNAYMIVYLYAGSKKIFC